MPSTNSGLPDLMRLSQHVRDLDVDEVGRMLDDDDNPVDVNALIEEAFARGRTSIMKETIFSTGGPQRQKLFCLCFEHLSEPEKLEQTMQMMQLLVTKKTAMFHLLHIDNRDYTGSFLYLLVRKVYLLQRASDNDARYQQLHHMLEQVVPRVDWLFIQLFIATEFQTLESRDVKSLIEEAREEYFSWLTNGGDQAVRGFTQFYIVPVLKEGDVSAAFPHVLTAHVSWLAMMNADDVMLRKLTKEDMTSHFRDDNGVFLLYKFYLKYLPRPSELERVEAAVKELTWSQNSHAYIEAKLFAAAELGLFDVCENTIRSDLKMISSAVCVVLHCSILTIPMQGSRSESPVRPQ